MGYRLMGALHAHLLHTTAPFAGSAGRSERGQGTVEYVALILLIAVVLGAVVVAGKGLKDHGIAKVVVEKLKDSIDTVGGK